jgi:hypothetical protein
MALCTRVKLLFARKAPMSNDILSFFFGWFFRMKINMSGGRPVTPFAINAKNNIEFVKLFWFSHLSFYVKKSTMATQTF